MGDAVREVAGFALGDLYGENMAMVTVGPDWTLHDKVSVQGAFH